MSCKPVSYVVNDIFLKTNELVKGILNYACMSGSTKTMSGKCRTHNVRDSRN